MSSKVKRMPMYEKPTDISEFLKAAKYAPVISVDTETNAYDIRDGRGFCMGTSIAFGFNDQLVHSTYFPFRHKHGVNYQHFILDQVKDLIETHDAVVFHNAKFDLVSLNSLGINRTGLFYDTMLMAHMVNENLLSKSLDFCSRWFLKEKGKDKADALDMFIKASGWENVPAIAMFDYACRDAELTLALYYHLNKEMSAQSLYDGELWEYEQEFVRTLIAMERRGVRIDQELAAEQYALGIKTMAEIQSKLKLNPASPKDLEKLLINELGLPVVKRTPGGKPSFDKFAMGVYDELLEVNDNDLAKQILTYRGWQKTTSSNYHAYMELLSPDGRIRPNYKIHGTVTGRLSCEKPNLQQIPRSGDNPWNGKLKKAFIAKEGFTLYEIDYSQLELRLATAYANEEGLKAAFAEGRDVFTEMSNELGMARHDVKTLTYTIQYGGGVNRVSTVFKLPEYRAKEIIDNFYAKYPGFREKTRIAQRKTFTQGYLKLWSGRRRHFVDPQSEAHKAFNSVIQGGAAEIMKRQMVRLHNTLDNEEECRMLLQVHDSVVLEIRDDVADNYLPEIKQLMEDVKPDFGVKFAADLHKWSE